MAHSLFAMLHRRFGPKLSGEQRAARATDKRLEFARQLKSFSDAGDCGGIVRGGVAIVGAGLAGLTAGWMLRQANVPCTVFEAADRIGGRVETDRNLIPGRLIEAGAELIGMNHGMWLELARRFRLGMIVLTSEDQYVGMGLEPQLRLKGALVTDQKKLYDQMKFVFQRMSNDAKVITNPFAPWTASGAAALDAKSVADKLADYVRLIPIGIRHPRLADALEMQLVNDQTLPIADQSYLGLLALVAGGQFGKGDTDLEGYWTTSEDFRCAEGNDALAGNLLERAGRIELKLQSPVTKIELPDAGVAARARVTWKDLRSGQTSSREFDYVILAAPPSVWKRITITPALPAGMEMAMGPAIKYLSGVRGRFWIKRHQAPSGLWDEIGQTWESTENQAREAIGIGLSVFAGGVHVPATDGAKHFRTRLPTLYPDFSELVERYVDWPSRPFIESGQSCPKLGQVTTIAKFLSVPYKTRLYFAGEHACMAFFGYMEGALQSGRLAAEAILSICVRGKMASVQPRPRPEPRHEPLVFPVEPSIAQRSPSRFEEPVHPQRAGREIVATREALDDAFRLRMTGTDGPIATMMGSPARAWRWSPIAEEDTPPETPAVTVPSGLALVLHSHIRRTCPDGRSFTSASSATTMSPATMNPGFLKADDTIEFDSTLDGKLTQLILDTPAYATMASAESRRTRTPHSDDKLRVALVDLTGDKICKPGFAGWGSTFAMPGGSTSKILILYAAHQLVFDLNEMARAGSIMSKADLTSQAASAWSGLTCKPDMNWLVDLDDSSSRVEARASAKLRTHLNEMVTRSFSSVSVSRASELMLRLGFEYLASVAFQSGLRHSTRGGVWFGNTYLNAAVSARPDSRCHKGDNPIVWSTNPLGATGITLTALSTATFFILLAQRRLVNATAATAMETLLETGCGFVAIPGVTVRARKCGLTSSVRHDGVLLEAPGRLYALGLLTTDPSWAHRSAFVRDLDRLVKENNP
jgi:monoamine oxidase